MIYDDIIVGSGLSALATVIGIDSRRKVLVIADTKDGRLRNYNSSALVPSGYRGFGGLGNFWHGVIGFGLREPFAREAEGYFEELFRYFYPNTFRRDKIGGNWLFVPRSPIRPLAEWKRLSKARGTNLSFCFEAAKRYEHGVATVVSESSTHRAKRLWICAGVLDTPQLLERSGVTAVQRKVVSDHVICLMGQIDRSRHPHFEPVVVEHARRGYWLRTVSTGTENALVTLKPARFDYRIPDRSFVERTAFGLPTGSAISKILRSGSPGLFAEALFNKYGLFPRSSMINVYGQVHVPGAYYIDQDSLRANDDALRAAIAFARAKMHLPEMVPTQERWLYLNGIHLHNSLDLSALRKLGLNNPSGVVQIMDASIISSIGIEHPTFQLMANAYRLAKKS